MGNVNSITAVDITKVSASTHKGVLVRSSGDGQHYLSNGDKWILQPNYKPPPTPAPEK